MLSWIAIASSRIVAPARNTAVGVMPTTSPTSLTALVNAAPRMTSTAIDSQPTAYRVEMSRRRTSATITTASATPPAARTSACLTPVDT